MNLPSYAIQDISNNQKPWTGANSVLDTTSSVVFDPDIFLNFINMTTTQRFDEFFSALVCGRHGAPEEDLLGPENVPRLIVAVQNLFRVLFAQQLSATFHTADPRICSTYLGSTL